MTEVKIGIVTYWKSTCNYGEQLQNYALQEYLRRQGHDPFLIRYDYENDTIYGSRPLHIRLLRACNPKRLIGHFKTKSDNKKRLKESIDHPRGFEKFREEHIAMSRVYSSIDDLRNDPPEADMYITGSDQVWNTYDGSLVEMRNRLSAFFLDFGKENVIRMSYAASWGRTSIPEEEKEYIRPLLAEFNAVSVREETGISLCKEAGRNDALLALDPVLLHDADSYRELYLKECGKNNKDKYLFIYYLGNDGINTLSPLLSWAASKNLKVVYVTDDWHDGIERTFPTVAEWLELIDNAEYVVTNSYHCSLFSLIFGKRFGILERQGFYSGMNSRMDSLFKMYGIEPRIITNNDFEILNRPADIINTKEPDGVLTPDNVISLATGSH